MLLVGGVDVVEDVIVLVVVAVEVVVVEVVVVDVAVVGELVLAVVEEMEGLVGALVVVVVGLVVEAEVVLDVVDVVDVVKYLASEPRGWWSLLALIDLERARSSRCDREVAFEGMIGCCFVGVACDGGLLCGGIGTGVTEGVWSESTEGGVRSSKVRSSSSPARERFEG